MIVYTYLQQMHGEEPLRMVTKKRLKKLWQLIFIALLATDQKLSEIHLGTYHS